ncbi:MAG: hypothetical protein ACP5UM_10770 [Anaerolineae bacterium]
MARLVPVWVFLALALLCGNLATCRGPLTPLRRETATPTSAFAFPARGVVTEPGAVLHVRPDPSSGTLGTCAQGTQVTAFGPSEDGMWLLVLAEDLLSGWIEARKVHLYGPVQGTSPHVPVPPTPFVPRVPTSVIPPGVPSPPRIPTPFVPPRVPTPPRIPTPFIPPRVPNPPPLPPLR